MNRRKAKKAFKKKWAQPGRLPLYRTVPNKDSPRLIDAVNEAYQCEIEFHMDMRVLLGPAGPTRIPRRGPWVSRQLGKHFPGG